MIGIVDYGLGNVGAFLTCLSNLNINAEAASDPHSLSKFSHLILPGVGSFDSGMNSMNNKGFDEYLRKAASIGKFILGICLGMQLLFSRSDESKSDTKGLNILEGSVSKIEIDKYNGIYVPHVGWNSIYESENNDTSLINVNDSKDFYFVNSYHVLPEDRKIIKYYFRHGKEYAAIIRKENIIATQFHPEKSKNGLIILNNFCNLK